MSQVVQLPEVEVEFKKIEEVLVGGDLSKLTSQQRVMHYKRVCESLDLNPLTKPFDYILLSGKLTFYAKKDATDQLRFRRNVSIQIRSREHLDDLYVVTAQAQLPSGRQDESVGAVCITGLKGADLANAMMKAETKAKRRATLSICGLGIPDESEIEDMAQDARGVYPEQPGPNDGVQNLDVGYRIPGGQWARKRLEEVPVEDLRAYAESWDAKIQAGKTPPQWVPELLRRIEEYVGGLELAPLDDAAAEPSPGEFARFQSSRITDDPSPPPAPQPAARTRQTVAVEIAEAVGKLGLNWAVIGERCRKEFKKETAQLDLPEMEKLLADLKRELAKSGGAR